MREAEIDTIFHKSRNPINKLKLLLNSINFNETGLKENQNKLDDRMTIDVMLQYVKVMADGWNVLTEEDLIQINEFMEKFLSSNQYNKFNTNKSFKYS